MSAQKVTSITEQAQLQSFPTGRVGEGVHHRVTEGTEERQNKKMLFTLWGALIWIAISAASFDKEKPLDKLGNPR
jgi:hypothetical protein